MEAELETGVEALSFALSVNSELPLLDFEAYSTISSDPNEKLMLSASDSEGLGVGMQEGASAG